MSNTELTIKRLLPASPEVVFDAWTTPSHMAGWFSPMTDATIPRMDLRVGGEYQIDMHGGKQVHVHTGKFIEIDRPNKLVFSWVSEGTDHKETIVALEFKAQEGGTMLTLTHSRFATTQAVANHTKGWTEIVGKLEAILSSEAKTGA